METGGFGDFWSPSNVAKAKTSSFSIAAWSGPICRVSAS